MRHYNFNRLTIKRTWLRRIKPLFDGHYSMSRKNLWGKIQPMDIFTTNICNLKCYSCSAKCNEPFGSNIIRKNPYIIKEKELEDFLVRAMDFGIWIRITGGEPTTMPLHHLNGLIKLAHSYGYKVDLLTNGFKLFDYLEYNYEIPDNVTLDRHGINNKDIEKSLPILDRKNINYYIMDVMEHRDLEYQRHNNITKGVNCSIFLKNISLAHGVIHPCCASFVVEAWNNTNEISNKLDYAGWNTYNRNLFFTIKDWRNTLPSEWFKMCLLNCWMDGNNIRYERNVE